MIDRGYTAEGNSVFITSACSALCFLTLKVEGGPVD